MRAAIAAIAVMGSGTGSGDDSRSENQTESIALFSHVSTKRQKKSGPPSAPPGQGPGMTPIRYLMSMAPTLALACDGLGARSHSRRTGIHSPPGAQGASGVRLAPPMVL